MSSVQVECTESQYHDILVLAFKNGFVKGSYRYMLGEWNKYKNWYRFPALYLERKELVGNDFMHEKHRLVSLDEFYKLMCDYGTNKKEINVMNELNALGLAKSVEKNLQVLGIKCLEDRLVESIIKKVGVKFGFLTMSEMEVNNVKSLIDIGSCEKVEINKAEISNIEVNDFDQDKYDDCGQIDDQIEDLLYEIDDIDDIEFNDVIDEAVLLKERLVEYNMFNELNITTQEMDAIIFSLKAHKTRQENLFKDFESFRTKVREKLCMVQETIYTIQNNC